MKSIGLSVVLTGALATPAFACDLCAVYSAAQAHGEIGKGFFAGIAEQFTHFGTLQEDGRKVPNPVGQYENSSISQLAAGYNFTERFGIQFNLPVIYRSFKRPDGFDIDRGHVFGLGDVALLANVNAFSAETKEATFRVNLHAGVKLPTGSSSRLQEEVDELTEPPPLPGAPESGIHGHDLALGTGSVDGIVGAGVFSRWKRFFLSGDAQYSIRTKGDFDYRYANDLTWSGGPGFFLALSEEFTLALQANISGEYKARDTFMGMRAEDTAITAVYFGPRVLLSWSDRLSAQVGVDLPLSIKNSALQAVPDYRVTGGLTWHF